MNSERRRFLKNVFILAGGGAAGLYALSKFGIEKAEAGFIIGSGAVDGAPPGCTEEFIWDGDHGSGTTYADIINCGSTLNGTLSGATVEDLSSDPGVDSSNGGNGLKCTAWNTRMYYPITTGNIFSSSAGLITGEIYISGALAGLNSFFYSYYDNSNYLELIVNADGTLKIRSYGQGIYASSTTTDTILANTWTGISARWSASGDTVGVRVGAGSWVDNSTTVNVFGTEPSTIVLGTDPGSQGRNNTFYLDDFHVWTTYDGS